MRPGPCTGTPAPLPSSNKPQLPQRDTGAWRESLPPPVHDTSHPPWLPSGWSKEAPGQTHEGLLSLTKQSLASRSEMLNETTTGEAAFSPSTTLAQLYIVRTARVGQGGGGGGPDACADSAQEGVLFGLSRANQQITAPHCAQAWVWLFYFPQFLPAEEIQDGCVCVLYINTPLCICPCSLICIVVCMCTHTSI